MKQPNIITHLQNVLFLHKTVILPDVGEFSKRESSATINEFDNVIVPPKKSLHFNANIKQNDFVLVKYIAAKEQISEAEAQHHLDVYTGQLQERLTVGHTIDLLQIGKLSKDLRGNYLFVSNEEANYSLDTFGLPPVQLPEIKADKGLEISAADTVVGAGTGLHTTIEKKEIEQSQNNLKNAWIGADEEIDDYMLEKETNNDGTIAAILAAKAEKNAAKMPLQEPLPPENKKKRAGFWMWLLPIMILCLFFFLLLQLSSSDKAWWEHKPFSYFAKDKTTVIADNSADGNNGNATNNGSGSSETSGLNANNGSNSGGINTNNGSNTTANSTNTDNNKSGTTANVDKTNANNTTNNSSTKKSSSSTEAAKAEAEKAAAKAKAEAEKAKNTTTASSAELNNIKINEPKANEYLATNSPKGYYVVIGAFKGDTNANKKIQDLKKQGFTAHSLPTKSGWNRVGIYNTDVNKAKQQLLTSKKKHNKGAWLLHFK